MRLNKLTTAILPMCCLAFVGCGSDDDTQVAEPKPPVVTPVDKTPLDNVFGRVDAEKTMPKKMTISIASNITGQNPKWGHPTHDCEFNPAKKRFCNNGKLPPGVEASDRDYSLMYTTQHQYEYDYILKDVVIDLTEHELETLRPDWFQKGHGSALDLLLLAAKKYDLDVEYFYDEELDTYWIESINGVKGLGPEQVANFKGATEPYGPCTEVGGWKYEYAVTPWYLESGIFFHTEEEYKQVDRKPINDNGKVFFIPACKEEIELRKGIYLKEQERLAKNNGKVIVPEVIIEWDWDKHAIFKNVEVTPHNLRTDMFKPGVITVADIMLSLAENNPAVDMHMNWWPTLSNGAVSNSYVLNRVAINGVDDEGHVFNVSHAISGTSGFVYHNGELERSNDSTMTALLYKDIMCNFEFTGSEYWKLPTTECPGGTWRQTKIGEKGWLPPYFGDRVPESPFGKDENGKNRAYFHYVFGGNDVHALSDVVPIVSPEYLSISRASFNASDEFLDSLINKGEDMKGVPLESPLPPELNHAAFDITKAKAPLTEAHFGWKQADCATCHDKDTNKGHVVEEMAPFECAQCHGNNGAPYGHGEKTTCGWCHASNLTLHGDAYPGPNVPEGEWNEATSVNKKFGFNAKPAEYFNLHGKFPEPASCMTCHPNQ